MPEAATVAAGLVCATQGAASTTRAHALTATLFIACPNVVMTNSFRVTVRTRVRCFRCDGPMRFSQQVRERIYWTMVLGIPRSAVGTAGADAVAVLSAAHTDVCPQFR